MTEFVPLWRRAITAEVCWLDADGVPAALAATPLLDRGVPCVAVPYARAAEVAGLRHAERVAFAVTDSRSLPGSGAGRVRVGAVEVVDDTEGDHFTVELLRQELVKYPPSRTLADSPLLCRENWWWLPRVIVRLRHAEGGPGEEGAPRLPARTNPARHALLVRERDAQPHLDTVEVTDTAEAADGAAGDTHPGGPGTRLRLRAADGTALRGDGSTGMVFGYDYSIPDLERWETWSATGPLWGDELTVRERHGSPGAELAPLRLVQRLRRQRDLARRCKRNILAAENRR